MALSLKKTGKTKDVFALDIGSSSVKVIQMTPHGNGRKRTWTLTGVGQSPINRSIVADKTVVNAVALGQAIEAALRSAGIRSKTAWTALPKAQSVSKIFSIPSGLGILEQEDQVAVEAVNHIPFPLETVRYDHEILGQAKDPGTGEVSHDAVEVLFVAAKSENVDTLVGSLSETGIDVELLDVDELAIERGMRWMIDQNPLGGVDDPIEAVIDLGHEVTVIHVLQNGRSIYTREQSFGMKHLTDEAGKRYGLKAEKVEDILSGRAAEDTSLPDNFEQDVVAPFRSEVANTVNRMIQFFFASTSFNRVHRIWLLGGGAGLSGVVQEVADATGVPTRLANPFEHVQVAGKIDAQQLQSVGPCFLQAFGIAIHASPTETSTAELRENEIQQKVARQGKAKSKSKSKSKKKNKPGIQKEPENKFSPIEDNIYGGVNLIPWRTERRKVRQTDFVSKIAVAAGAGALVAGALWLIMAGQVNGQQKRNAWVENQIEEAKKKLEDIQDLERQRASLLGRKQVIERLQADRDLLPRVMFEVANANVDGTLVTGYDHQSGVLNIYGKATSNAAVAALARNMERSAWFSRPEIVVIKNEDDSGATGVGGSRASANRVAGSAIQTAEAARQGGGTEARRQALSDRYTYVFTVRAGVVNPNALATEEESTSEKPAGGRDRK